MSRRMSCSLTVDAVRSRTKTVTRRHIDTWRDLKPGDHLTLIEKGMGLKKGAKQVVLAEVEIVDVRIEPLWMSTAKGECTAEGFPQWEAEPLRFAIMWLESHKGAPLYTDTRVRRIEWQYLA